MNVAKYKRHIIIGDRERPNLEHYFLIMELYDKSLKDVIDDYARYIRDEDRKIVQDQVHITGIPRENIINWVFQIGQALTYIHYLKIIHRDVKPGNIFLNRDSIAKLGDFGAGRLLKETKDFSATFCGTFEYLAPEIFGAAGKNGEKIRSYNKSADLWALGATLLELLTTYNTPLEGQFYSLPRSQKDGVYFATQLAYSPGRQLCFIRAEPNNIKRAGSVSSMIEPSGLFRIAFKLLEMNQKLRLGSYELVAELDSEMKRDRVIKLSKEDFIVYKTMQCGAYGNPVPKFWLHSGSGGLSVRLQHFTSIDAWRDKELNKFRDQMANIEGTRWQNRLGFCMPAIPRQKEQIDQGDQGDQEESRPLSHESGNNQSYATSSNRSTVVCSLFGCRF